MGKSEQRELETRMAVLLAHLLKWQYQPTHRGRSWLATIREQRKMIAIRLKQTPSLKKSLSDSCSDLHLKTLRTAFNTI